MKEYINKERLKNEFLNLVKVSSESYNEKNMAEYLASLFNGLASEIIYDTSKSKTKSNSNNLIVKLRGNKKNVPPLLLCAHLDTVTPGNNIKPVIEGDIIKSDGNTILGGDCKSGIAIIIEVVRALRERGIEHGDLELLFTVCEEVGLIGAKYLDYLLIKSKLCYVLDTSGVISIVNKAPSANKMTFKIYGKEAHAGLEPEKGINAIKIAARALELMPLGRIDFETTANIGKIQGGTATNTVPSLVVLEGEARSHSNRKLAQQTNNMRKAVAQAVSEFNDGNDKNLPYFEEDIALDYERFEVSKDDYLIRLCESAAKEMGETLTVRAAGGGSDANVFNTHGIAAVNFATGMNKVHTVEECIDVNDICKSALLLLNVIKLYC